MGDAPFEIRVAALTGEGTIAAETIVRARE